MPSRRDSRKDCVCVPPREWDRASAVECRWHTCVWFICPRCGRRQGGWGAVGCRCERYIRWIYHPAMKPQFYRPEEKGTPVKPSLRRPAQWRKLR